MYPSLPLPLPLSLLPPSPLWRRVGILGLAVSRYANQVITGIVGLGV